MKYFGSAKQSWIIVIAVLLPVMVGLARDIVLHNIASNLHVQGLGPAAVDSAICETKLCSKRTHFSLDQATWASYRHPSIGYFGAQLDSYVSLAGKPYDEITSEEELKFTWPRFRVFSFSQSDYPNDGDLSVVAVSPRGTKKLGLESGRLYYGEKHDLETLQFVYSLFNIHLYLLLALLVISLGLGIALSAQADSEIDIREVALSTSVAAGTLVTFTTIFDEVLRAIHVPSGVVENLPRFFWAPALFVHILPRGKVRFVSISLWISWVAGASFDTSAKPFFLYETYRWAVLAVVGIGILRLLRFRQARFSFFYLLLALNDAFALFGLLPVKSAFYLSPLGVFGLFFGAHLPKLISILEHHRYWYERRQLARSLNDLRSSEMASRDQWYSLLGDFCTAISRTTYASKVSLCYLGFDSPLIISTRSGQTQRFEDGQLPPVFARVIQTKEYLWWITDDELATFLPGGKSLRRTDVYHSNRAVILPILVGGEAYGAIALTDFRDLEKIMASDDRRHQMESTITSFLDLISVQLVKKKEASSNTVQKDANELVRSFSVRATFARTREETIKEFLSVLSRQTPCSAMYFDFEPSTERLHISDAINMTPELLAQWKEIPFRARPTNRLSPFAISINEKRSVFVENIQSFFNFLVPQSIDALTASKTRGFVCAPVIFGESVFGLLAALDLPGSKPLSAEFAAMLELPLKYLAFQLDQHRMHTMIASHEKALSRFADPNLAKLISEAGERKQLAIGYVGPAVIVVQDLRGSTEACRRERDAQKLAECFAEVYEVAAGLATDYGASFEKSNGDGTITTLPATLEGNGDGLLMALRMFDEVGNEAKRILGIRDSIVCIHRGTPFRGVMGTTRRIAWDICGADVNDTFSIEKCAKKVSGVVLAVSFQFVELEMPERQILMKTVATHVSSVDGLDGDVLMFDVAGVKKLRDSIRESLGGVVAA